MTFTDVFRITLRRLPWLLLAGALGCASTKPVDWASLVGTYTLDQAILDLGPPDKDAKLEDGTVVAEWMTRQGYYLSHVAPGYDYSPCYPSGLGFSHVVSQPIPSRFIRLIFGPEGTLVAWKKLTK